MWRKFFSIPILVMLAGAASADEATKQTKVMQLTRALGLQESFESVIAARKEQEKTLSKQMVDELLTGEQVKNEALRNRLNAALLAFDSKLASSASAEGLTTAFAQAFGARFTEEEIDRLLHYYNSDLGKKEVAASRDALNEMTEKSNKEQEATLSKAAAEFKAELEKIVAESSAPVKRPRRK